MVSTTVIGAIVGVLIGVVLLIVLITCIIYISRKLKKKTNSRSKIISSDGLVIKDNWAEDEDVKKYFANEDNRRKLARPEVMPWYDAPFFGRLPRALKPNAHLHSPDYATDLQNVSGYHHPKLFYQKPTNAFPDFTPAAGFHTIPTTGRYPGGAPIPNNTVKSRASKAASMPTVRTLQPTTLRNVALPPLGREPLPSLHRYQPQQAAAEAERARPRPADVVPAGMAAAAAASAIPAVAGWSALQRPLERLVEEPEGIVPALQRLGNSLDWPPQLNAIKEGNVMDYLPEDLRNGADFLRNEFVPKLQANTPPHFRNEMGVNSELPLNWRNEPPPNFSSKLPPNLRTELPTDLRNENLPPNISHEYSHDLRNDLPPNLRSELPPNLRSDPTANLRNEPPRNLRSNMPQYLPDEPPENVIGEPPPHLRSEPPPHLRSEPPPNLRSEPPPNLRNEPPPNLRSEPPPNLRSEPPPNLRSEIPSNLRTEPPPNLRSEPPPNLRSEIPPNLRTEPPQNLRSEPPPNLRSEPQINLRSELPPNLRSEPPPNLRSEPPTNLRSEPPPNLRSEPPPNLRSEITPNLRTEPHPSVVSADGFPTENETHQPAASSQARNSDIIVPEPPVEVLRTPRRTNGQMKADNGPSVQLNRNTSLSSKYTGGDAPHDGNSALFTNQEEQ